MKAFIFDYAEKLKVRFTNNFPEPTNLGSKQVKVKTISAAFNPLDFKVPEIPGLSWIKKNTPAGFEMCGKIVSVGSGVTKFKVGDIIYGQTIKGTMAEFAVAGENEVALVIPVTSKVEPDAHVVKGTLPPFRACVYFPPLLTVIEDPL